MPLGADNQIIRFFDTELIGRLGGSGRLILLCLSCRDVWKFVSKCGNLVKIYEKSKIRAKYVPLGDHTVNLILFDPDIGGGLGMVIWPSGGSIAQTNVIFKIGGHSLYNRFSFIAKGIIPTNKAQQLYAQKF